MYRLSPSQGHDIGPLLLLVRRPFQRHEEWGPVRQFIYFLLSCLFSPTTSTRWLWQWRVGIRSVGSMLTRLVWASINGPWVCVLGSMGSLQMSAIDAWFLCKWLMPFLLSNGCGWRLFLSQWRSRWSKDIGVTTKVCSSVLVPGQPA